MGKKWTKQEENWLIDNYSILGYEICSNKLNRSNSAIENKCHKLKLKLSYELRAKKISKPNSMCNINPDLFYNITNKNISYLLGFMWADGFTQKNKSGSCSTLGIKINYKDMDNLKPIFNAIGKWGYYTREYNNSNWLDSVTMSTNNKRIYDFLIENDYGKKSTYSPNKILSKIPDNLKPYFYLGLVDGDGCFYFCKNKNNTLKQFSITSTYEQDWSYMINLCDGFNIKYSIKKTSLVNKKTGNLNSSSQFRITNKPGIVKIGDYIYTDLIGLERKYNKFLKIKNS